MEFEKMFSDEQKCLEYLIKLRWPDGFICPRCKHKNYWLTKRNQMMCKKCQNQTTPTVNTIFHKSKKPLTVYFRAIWWIVAQKNGVSASGIMRILGLGSYHTAWKWLHKFRRLMIIPGREKLSGKVEVDETFIGGSKSGKRGRGAAGKTLIIVAVELKEIGTGRIRLGTIPDASNKSLKKFIVKNIEKDSCIVTDGWKSYKGITNEGYKHEIADNSGEDVLPNVHRIAALLKRWLLGTHQNYVNESYLSYYLDEFTFRHNRRKSKSRGLLFETLIKQAIIHKPIKGAELKGI